MRRGYPHILAAMLRCSSPRALAGIVKLADSRSQKGYESKPVTAH